MNIMDIKISLSKRTLRFLITVVAVFGGSLVWAAGLLCPVQNTTNLGTAFAGCGSLATDASTNFYNAAGLTRLNNPQWVVGATYLFPDSKLDVTQATASAAPAVLGPGTARPKNQALIPFFHYAQPLDGCWSVGLSVASTFGSKANYDENSLVRYTATRSQLALVDTAPSVGYRLTDQLSLGAGPDFVFAKLGLDTAVGVTGNRAQDGFSKTNAKRAGLGFHVGGLYEWDDCTRFGLTYRSDYTIRLKGDSVTQIPVGAPGAGTIIKKGLRANVHFPEIVTLSGYRAINDLFAVMADLRWTRWERVKQFVVGFNDGSHMAMVFNWKNTWLGAVGGIFQPNPEWQFKLGVAYENTPTTDTTRMINILEQDQTTLAMGLKYQFSRCVAVDIAYHHVLFKKMNINQPAPIVSGFPAPMFQTVQGKARQQVRAVGLQLTWDIL